MNIKWQKPETSEPKAVTFGELEIGEAYTLDHMGWPVGFQKMYVRVKVSKTQCFDYVLKKLIDEEGGPTVHRVTVNATAWPTEMMQ